MKTQIKSRQFQEPESFIANVDGSAVTTTASKTGLNAGQHCCTVKKGTGADSNLVTITFVKPFGIAPQVFFQPITLDCECREDSATSKTQIFIRTLKSSNLATGVDDADFRVFVEGTQGIQEGNYP